MEQQEQQSINPPLGNEQAKKLLYQMLLIRKFEEKSAEMYTQEKIRGFLHLYVGEEAVAVGVMQALRPEDNVLCTYREHGHALVRGLKPGVIMAEMYGRQEGCSRGRGGSMHLFDAKTKFYGGNAIVAGHLAMAVGMALADKKMKRDQLTCCFFGEGAMAEGAFHEAMNLAALWQVPVLFLCENNLYAMGTALRYTHAQTNLELKGAAFGIDSSTVDGMDLLAVIKAANTAVAAIRKTGKPHFLVCNTYRFRAHSMFDAELYRDKSEVEEWKKRDPIPGYFNYLLQQQILTDVDFKKIEGQVELEVKQAVDFAETCSLEPVEELTKYTYSEKQD
ncbi:pyruvate dehydrogenase (acetyl-transferring) E1 component subunit alpha [Pontibacter anaerobius]|uniref:Pyruvate dehydrogenase E1 component subunit alpha n=1 Tax=Pontibacter anaerobius TaxID=2993940 RepID=A0ABT3RBY4_9BACT|nr:pyruvate dehydrogenase (acetyl-transferring) E1 component subunit alpha [Pontibacter anaerobius]MCX2739036.1 pyruvate dehydrogenase (acetyl-transferring) E1 component subunit alpha [Pontibacter anaerobius]